MDENSCEGETSESAKNAENAENASNNGTTKTTDEVSQLTNVGVRINLEGKNVPNPVSERCGSSIDASASVSGPSTDYIPPKPENDEETTEVVKNEEPPEVIPEPQPSVHSTEEQSSSMALPVDLEPQGSQQLTASAEEQEASAVNVGPPPSYSFVMKEKKKPAKPTIPDPVMVDRLPPPPPSYSGNRRVGLPTEENTLERLCNLPSLAEPLWRSHSQPALCPRCGIIILTTIHSHDSLATHMAALALCLFGCWPCCLLPYCLNICKNTYHHCPICQTFLGAYTPW